VYYSSITLLHVPHTWKRRLTLSALMYENVFLNDRKHTTWNPLPTSKHIDATGHWAKHRRNISIARMQYLKSTWPLKVVEYNTTQYWILRFCMQAMRRLFFVPQQTMVPTCLILFRLNRGALANGPTAFCGTCKGSGQRNQLSVKPSMPMAI